MPADSSLTPDEASDRPVTKTAVLIVVIEAAVILGLVWFGRYFS
jgi:hypothetical protein